MSTYLDELIERVKREINQERKRVDHITSHTKRRETLANGTLRRLEQRPASGEGGGYKTLVTARSPETARARPLGRFADRLGSFAASRTALHGREAGRADGPSDVLHHTPPTPRCNSVGPRRNPAAFLG
jgi:hypothetical protein